MRPTADFIVFGVRLYTEFFLFSEECIRLIKDVKNIKVTGKSVLNLDAENCTQFPENIKTLQT